MFPSKEGGIILEGLITLNKNEQRRNNIIDKEVRGGYNNGVKKEARQMDDNMFSPIKNNTDTGRQYGSTTLMVTGVPSEVAYNILMDSIQSGQGLSGDELRQRVNDRTDGPHLQIFYGELIKYFEYYRTTHLISDEDKRILPKPGDFRYCYAERNRDDETFLSIPRSDEVEGPQK